MWGEGKGQQQREQEQRDRVRWRARAPHPPRADPARRPLRRRPIWQRPLRRLRLLVVLLLWRQRRLGRRLALHLEALPLAALLAGGKPTVGRHAAQRAACAHCCAAAGGEPLAHSVRVLRDDGEVQGPCVRGCG